MDQDQLHNVLRKYLEGSASTEDARLLRDWYRSLETEEVIWVLDEPSEMDRLQTRMLDRLQQEIRPPAPVRRLWPRLLVAAGVVLLLAGFAYIRYLRPSHSPVEPLTAVHDLPPGGNRATLILGGGQAITLDSAGQGMLAAQGSMRVVKSGNGQLEYVRKTQAGDAGDIAYNTIIIPNGGTYTVTLSDGSKVWLNAGSSLKYPVRFTGNARQVDLTGEAYFEVASNPAQPFTVHCLGQNVAVLGTRFNVNAYTNEPVIRTTLLEGRVRIEEGTHAVLLRAGEQSMVGADGTVRVSQDIDTAEAMAWRYGMFQFNAADIGTVMRQIGRWYDVDVVYEGKLPDDRFHGKIPRNVNASQALQILSIGGINFKIEGKKIILQ